MARVNLRVCVAIGVAGCAAPSAVATPIRPSIVSQQSGEVAAPPPTVEQAAYGEMAAIAMRQARYMTAHKTVGLYQGDDPRHDLYPIVKRVLEENPFREIHRGETKVACTVPRRPGLRGGGTSTPTCGLDIVNVLMQVNSVQIRADSGYVGGYLTEVLPGEDRPRSSAFCFIAVYRKGAWVDVKNSLVKEPRDCASDRRH